MSSRSPLPIRHCQSITQCLPIGTLARENGGQSNAASVKLVLLHLQPRQQQGPHHHTYEVHVQLQALQYLSVAAAHLRLQNISPFLTKARPSCIFTYPWVLWTSAHHSPHHFRARQEQVTPLAISLILRISLCLRTSWVPQELSSCICSRTWQRVCATTLAFVYFNATLIGKLAIRGSGQHCF